MPATIQIDPSARLVISTFTDEISEADVESVRHSLVNDPRFDPAFSHIIDFSKVTEVRVSSEFIRAFAKREPLFSVQAKQVVVAVQDFIFGLARMAQILREGQLPNVEVVRSLPEAYQAIATRQPAGFQDSPVA